MKPENILEADLLDIIFENKNKHYGAYSLRKQYNERLYKALGCVFFGALILVLMGVLNKNKTMNAPVIPEVWFAGPPVNIPLDRPSPPKSVVQPKQPLIKSTTSVDMKPVVDNTNSTNIIISKDADKIHEPGPDAGNIPGIEIKDGHDPAGRESGLPATGFAVDSDPSKTIDKAIPQAVEIMPSFPGGIEALGKFLKKNLVTPAGLDRGETISVKVQFVVGYDGELKGFRVIEDGGVNFNEEVIRVLKKMPAWIPGKANGENVSVYYTIPVMFTTEE
ncbi:MAG: energy transducer TonB [Ferruginibacter sp.]